MVVPLKHTPRLFCFIWPDIHITSVEWYPDTPSNARITIDAAGLLAGCGPFAVTSGAHSPTRDNSAAGGADMPYSRSIALASGKTATRADNAYLVRIYRAHALTANKGTRYWIKRDAESTSKPHVDDRL